MSVRFISETGLNANGVPWLLNDTICAFAAAGATDVKIQVRDVFRVYTPEFLASPRKSPWGAQQLDQKLAMEFSDTALVEAAGLCRELGVDFSASCWDTSSLERFIRLVRPAWLKIASPCLTDRELLTAHRETGIPLVVSTGMSTEAEIDEAMRLLDGASVTLLGCTSVYPAGSDDLNIRQIVTLRQRYGVPVGFSYHGLRPEPVYAAVALGAEVIEVHTTLSRALTGSDQKASWLPDEFAALVEGVREVEASLGDGRKVVLPRELPIRQKLRKAAA